MSQSTSIPTDQTANLVARASEGCVDSFEKLVRKYQMPLRAFLVSKTGDLSVADDLAQEVFLVALRKINTVQNHQSFQTWLFSVARNKAVDHVRKIARGKEIHSDGLEQLLAEPQRKLFAANDQLLEALQDCVAGLKPQARTLIEEFYFDNKSSDVIAKNNQTKSSAVRMSLMRIRKALAKCIRHKSGEVDE